MAAMKTAIRFLGVLARKSLVIAVLGAACVAGTARASERWETLEAIHRIENPFDSPRPGRFGELGPYQFRESTWRMHTAVPFARAVDRRVSDEVAVCHYEWLKRRLEGRGLPATPYNIALAWNAGVNAVLRGRVPASTHGYAERAANIAGELRRNQIALAR